MPSITDSNPVVLVIDTDPLMLTAVSAVLNMSGYDCHAARDAEAAVKAARSMSLDLIVCDLNLDGEDGLMLIHELRGLRGCENIPFILVSNDQTSDMVQQTHNAGGAYYLRKPYDPEVLLELVEKALWMPHLVNTRIEQASSVSPFGLSLGTPSPTRQTS